MRKESGDRDMVLFMQAARWADDVRTQHKAQNRPPWHYINLPFRPEGQPDTVQIREPEPINILTALASNESVVKGDNDAARRAIALSWLFHLVGDIHQPLHAVQLFSVDVSEQAKEDENRAAFELLFTQHPVDIRLECIQRLSAYFHQDLAGLIM